MSTTRGCPPRGPCLAGGISGSTMAHCSSVRSEGYFFRGRSFLNMATHSCVDRICANYLINLLFCQAMFPDSLSVNRCPFAVANYQRDGFMRVDGNGGSSPNYWPNSFDDMTIDQSYKEPPLSLEATVADWYDRNAPGDDDHYTQPGNLFRHVLTDTERQHLIDNIVASMQGITGPK